MNNLRQTWTCRIGVVGSVPIPPGGDSPMRDAVLAAFERVTGHKAEHCFSGWGDTWTPQQLAVIENRVFNDPAPCLETVTAERDSLRAQLAAERGTGALLRRDAYRYRWLRDGGYYLIEQDRGNGPMWPDAAEVDRLVDHFICHGLDTKP